MRLGTIDYSSTTTERVQSTFVAILLIVVRSSTINSSRASFMITYGIVYIKNHI